MTETPSDLAKSIFTGAREVWHDYLHPILKTLVIPQLFYISSKINPDESSKKQQERNSNLALRSFIRMGAVGMISLCSNVSTGINIPETLLYYYAADTVLTYIASKGANRRIKDRVQAVKNLEREIISKSNLPPSE